MTSLRRHGQRSVVSDMCDIKSSLSSRVSSEKIPSIDMINSGEQEYEITNSLLYMCIKQIQK